MDSDVLAAIAKWPDVPDVYGWLALTARGEWRLRGEPIGNAAIRAFIGRNYACDDAGRWFFQNGPQRVYVSLEVTPLILRLDTTGVTAHHGVRVRVCRAAALIDDGRFVVLSEIGPGLLDDRDLAQILPALIGTDGDPLDDLQLGAALTGSRRAMLDAKRLGLQGRAVHVERIALEQLASRFGFVRDPRPD